MSTALAITLIIGAFLAGTAVGGLATARFVARNWRAIAARTIEKIKAEKEAQ